jgi:hypothetical protein
VIIEELLATLVDAAGSNRATSLTRDGLGVENVLGVGVVKLQQRGNGLSPTTISKLRLEIIQRVENILGEGRGSDRLSTNSLVGWCNGYSTDTTASRVCSVHTVR